MLKCVSAKNNTSSMIEGLKSSATGKYKHFMD